MEKNRIIIIEGPQGTGKTTLANYLRENIASSNLYRLSGHKDKTISGKEVSKKMYNALLTYLEAMQDVGMDLIFDRTFFTEEVYARLGYKEYSFTDVYQDLLQKLNSLNYDIYFCLLYLKNPELYRERLQRESHHNYQSFSLENSVNQQNVYLEISQELKDTTINVLEIPMDNFAESYQLIRKKFKINSENKNEN